MRAFSPLMKLALGLGIVLVTFLGISKAATPAPKAPQILIQAKFVQIPTGTSGAAPLPAPLDVAGKVPRLIGTLTDPQCQTLIRALSQRKGVDLMSAPQLTARLGQEAKAEVARKFDYTNEAGKPATAKLGVALTVLAKMKGEGQFDLDLSPEIVDCDGFIDHKSGWSEPIFSVQQARKNVVMKSGQTAILEMEPKTDKQTVQEEDAAGRIESRTELHHSRTLVFVTAYLIDPTTGKPRR